MGEDCYILVSVSPPPPTKDVKSAFCGVTFW